MLIDGGGASDWSDLGRTVIGPYLWERGIRRLDVVVATHPQLDHVGGLRYVVQGFPIEEFWNSGMSRSMPFVQRLDEELASRQVPVKAVSTADLPLSWGPCTITVLNPSVVLLEVKHSVNTNAGGRDLNNTSVVLRLHCGTTSVLFTADIEQDAEARLLESGLFSRRWRPR
jgi:competence protein ComEC